MTIEEARWKLYLHYWMGKYENKIFSKKILDFSRLITYEGSNEWKKIVITGGVDEYILEAIDMDRLIFK